ncbi:LysR family transcriptional regulator [Denitromonas ohlonensis]|jgi:DNA-binding transcriptional LysR family regulator|uniref:LysR family transcriptional regulator n=2 Tax=Denitromonas TaxID=139331 RepID=A0A557SBH6_9RHOO|nr:LysR family transcriptional regulator [Denitromonas ohlonensis]TVO68484.1 LysR family transcriptional regulator [Denitromonas ohlonensis]TVO74762.1 LysR family transcriptional regulator [Denitromonas ohlonensis]TVT72220.1 MAG: LysR family transcriptional regulator [Denitromonas halophila]
MKGLQDLEIFVRTAELGSLSAAARRLDLTPAAASAALKRLEATLQAALFVRSTRSQRLTAEGEVFLLHCRQALDLLADGREALASGRSVVRGVLQLSLPSDLGRNVLLPWLDAFQAAHPQVELRLQVSDRLADVYRQPVDLAIRYGSLPDSSLVALPLLPDNRRVLCASPDYLVRYGTPTAPAQLADHNCLCYLLGDAVHDRWRFFRDGQETSVAVRGDRVSDDGDVVRRWALGGWGLAYKSRLDVETDLHAGRLVAVCQDWLGESAPLNLLCADRRQLSPVVQQLREFLSLRLAAL